MSVNRCPRISNSGITAANRSAPTSPSSSALVISAPIVESLPPLPNAAAEAEFISGLYSPSTVLRGLRATPSEVLKRLGESTVLHVAAHGLVPNDFGRPRILLSPEEPGDSGDLDTRMLLSSDLSGLRLAVLGTCRSTVGPWSETGGPLGLARIFARAGVDFTLAARFEVPDDQASAFLIDFHSQVAAGSTPLQALHQARSLAIERSADARIWSGFELFLGM